MTAEECMKLMRNDLIESHLPVAKIVDKYCNCSSSELRDSLIAQLESLRQLYSTKKILNRL